MLASIAASSSVTGASIAPGDDESHATSASSVTVVHARPIARSYTVVASMSASLEHRSDLDGLRGIAVLAVIAYHAVPGSVRGGFAGVDVFFVVSGFLIARIILRGLEAGSFSFATFYARRIRRLFPALVTVLACVWAFGWLVLLADEYRSLGTHVAGGAGFVSNVVSWSEVGYFDPAAETKPLLHLWSLGIEEQFYLAWPLVLWAAWRAGRTLAVTCVIFGSSALAYVVLPDSAAFYAPWARLWELMLGAGVAQLSGRIVLRAPVANALSCAGAAAIVGGLVGVPWIAVPAVGAAIVIAAGDQAWLNRVVLSFSGLVWVGGISYALYLWHWPLLSYLRILEGETPPLAHRLIVVAASIVLAAITTRWIERPIRSGRARVQLVALLAAMALLGTVGYVTFARGGFPSRAVQQNAPRFDRFGFTTLASCLDARPYARGGTCYATPTTYPETLLVLGDSHGQALASGLIAAATSGTLGRNLIVVVRTGCMPFAGTEWFNAGGTAVFGCRAWMEGALREATSDPRITTVILVGRHAARVIMLGVGDEPAFSGHVEAADGARDPVQVFRNGLAATIDRLVGKRVVFVDAVPELTFDPHACVRRLFELGRGDPQACSVPRAEVDARQRSYRELVTDPRLVRVDPVPLLCDAVRCSAWRDGVMMYHDNDHLSPEGAAVVTAEILARLR
jgi:peptidoglycan/LPS O-acetylase OafA/YrhL